MVLQEYLGHLVAKVPRVLRGELGHLEPQAFPVLQVRLVVMASPDFLVL